MCWNNHSVESSGEALPVHPQPHFFALHYCQTTFQGTVPLGNQGTEPSYSICCRSVFQTWDSPKIFSMERLLHCCTVPQMIILAELGLWFGHCCFEEQDVSFSLFLFNQQHRSILWFLLLLFFTNRMVAPLHSVNLWIFLRLNSNHALLCPLKSLTTWKRQTETSLALGLIMVSW